MLMHPFIFVLLLRKNDFHNCRLLSRNQQNLFIFDVCNLIGSWIFILRSEALRILWSILLRQSFIEFWSYSVIPWLTVGCSVLTKYLFENLFLNLMRSNPKWLSFFLSTKIECLYLTHFCIKGTLMARICLVKSRFKGYYSFRLLEMQCCTKALLCFHCNNPYL